MEIFPGGEEEWYSKASSSRIIWITPSWHLPDANPTAADPELSGSSSKRGAQPRGCNHWAIDPVSRKPFRLRQLQSARLREKLRPLQLLQRRSLRNALPRIPTKLVPNWGEPDPGPLGWQPYPGPTLGGRQGTFAKGPKVCLMRAEIKGNCAIQSPRCWRFRRSWPTARWGVVVRSLLPSGTILKHWGYCLCQRRQLY